MKKTFFATLIIFSLASCATASDKNLIEKVFEITEFTSINSNAVANITIIQSDTISLVAYGNEEAIEKLTIKNENGTLSIFTKKVKENKRNMRLSITITTPKMTNIVSEGVGNMKLSGNWQIDSLNLYSKGVGNILFENILADKLILRNEGVGNVNLNGEGNTIEIYSYGVGNIKSKDFKATNAKVTSEGIGNVDCFASDNLEIDMDGVGNVKYYGNPKIKNINKTGIGVLKSK